MTKICPVCGAFYEGRKCNHPSFKRKPHKWKKPKSGLREDTGSGPVVTYSAGKGLTIRFTGKPREGRNAYCVACKKLIVDNRGWWITVGTSESGTSKQVFIGNCCWTPGRKK